MRDKFYESVDLENYADVLFWALQESRAVPFKNGDMVVINFDLPAIDLVEAVYARLMDAHLRAVPMANPTPRMEVEKYLNSSFGQLIYQPPGLEELYKAASGGISILAPESLGHLQTVDPRTIAEARKAEIPCRRILDNRRRSGLLGWTTCLYPTEELAKAAGMELEDYAYQVLRSCWLNMPNPVKEWRRIKKEMREIADWLQGLNPKAFHVEGEFIDLRVPVGENRQFVTVNGANIPGMELYFAPDCREVQGVYFSDQPSLRAGHLVHGVTLEFTDGVTTRVNAEKGLVFLQNQLYSDAGARRVGEFSLTDKRFTRVDNFMAHTLLDENHGGEHGNCHIALGGSVTESFSGPQEALTPELEAALGFNTSSMHWDLVNTQPKRVSAILPGGRPKLIYEGGQFKV